jgi:hypothetical protein
MNDAVDVLRHGWQDAAGIFAPESPEIAELLQARLEMAVANGALDETHLLGAIDDVESMAVSTGSPSGQALARRLRRTVYEYLLALDAAPQPVVAAPAPGPAVETPDAVTEEVTALGHRAAPAQDAAQAPEAVTIAAASAVDDAPAAAPTTEDDEKVEANGESPERRSRFGLRRRQDTPELDEDASPEPDTDGDAAGPAPAAAGDGDVEPTWQYDPTTDTPAAAAPAAPEAQATAPPANVVAPPAAPEVGATDVTDAEHPDGFVAPKSGFHIVEDTHPTHAPEAAAESPLQMPAFAQQEATASSPEPDTSAASPAAPSSPAGAEGDLATYQWTRPVAASPPPVAAPAAGPSGPAPAAATAAATEERAEDFEIDSENGWRIRPGALTKQPVMDEDPFESNPKLAELRRRIDERLRRKRCDEAAALLQELAQETGGRVVAELAMNAGDRCQSLGKSNAALNCYLAASRADPVYELPLSRLADICIDDQDTELAVSYLERIARLYRFRGDDKAALRVYRRIATIAPYREDVLNVLLNAQNTGRFES